MHRAKCTTVFSYLKTVKKCYSKDNCVQVLQQIHYLLNSSFSPNAKIEQYYTAFKYK